MPLAALSWSGCERLVQREKGPGQWPQGEGSGIKGTDHALQCMWRKHRTRAQRRKLWTQTAASLGGFLEEVIPTSIMGAVVVRSRWCHWAGQLASC